MSKVADNLFGSFLPPSRADWLNAAGSDFSQVVADSISLPAILSRDDTGVLDRTALLQRDSDYMRGRGVRVDLTEPPESEFARTRGYGHVGVTSPNNVRFDQLAQCQYGLHLSAGLQDVETLQLASRLAKHGSKGSLLFSDLDSFTPAVGELAKALNDVPTDGRFRLLGINLAGDENGSVAVRVAVRVALACAWARYLIETFAAQGVAKAAVANHLHFTLPAYNSFWVQIAALRATRAAVATTLKEQNIAPPPFLITSEVYPDILAYKPEFELIRYAAIASASMLGGADMISAARLSVSSSANDDENQRLLASTQLSLAHEAGLDAIPDPAGGSYYAEALSVKIASAGWELYSRQATTFPDVAPTLALFQADRTTNE